MIVVTLLQEFLNEYLCKYRCECKQKQTQKQCHINPCGDFYLDDLCEPVLQGRIILYIIMVTYF